METIGKVEKVEVFSDRPYYVVEYIDGKISFKMLSTRSLTEIIATLRQLNRMDENAMLIACCYEQYSGGSFNIEVNPDEQYKEIYKYANRKFKTFMSKTIEANLDEVRMPMTKEEVLNERLDEIRLEIKQTKNILSWKYNDDEKSIKYWTEQLNNLENEEKNILKEIDNFLAI
jgi:hypothetical protein